MTAFDNLFADIAAKVTQKPAHGRPTIIGRMPRME
jgi:hypothetical protein